MQRDDFKCCACGVSPAKDLSVELRVGHIIPWPKGGETELDNLQALYSKRNLGKVTLLKNGVGMTKVMPTPLNIFHVAVEPNQNAIFSSSQAFSSLMGIRTCSMVSRSRTVTQLSASSVSLPTVWKSTVTQ